MITQDAVQYSGAVRVGSVRASPTCFTGRRVTPCSDAPSPSPSNIIVTKVSRSAFSKGLKASPMMGVTRCNNSHSCWRDFCSPSYADSGCLRETPARVFTDTAHPVTFPASHLFSASLSPMNTPRYLFPVTTLIPIPRKKSSAWATFRGATTKILLVGSGSIPLDGPAPASPEDAPVCTQTFLQPPHHTRTTAV